MDLISKIEDLKNFGIDLKLESSEMEVFYVKSMKYFFDEKDLLFCRQVSDLELEISDEVEPIATVFVKDSVLRIIPLGEDPYSVLMEVLEFVANLHKPTIALFKGIEESTGKPPVSKASLVSHEEPEEDSDDDFDDEWI